MKTIGSLKVDEKTLSNMKMAIKKYNEQNMFSVNEAEFRRMALELLSQVILQDIKLPIKIVT